MKKVLLWLCLVMGTALQASDASSAPEGAGTSTAKVYTCSPADGAQYLKGLTESVAGVLQYFDIEVAPDEVITYLDSCDYEYAAVLPSHTKTLLKEAWWSALYFRWMSRGEDYWGNFCEKRFFSNYTQMRKEYWKVARRLSSIGSTRESGGLRDAVIRLGDSLKAVSFSGDMPEAARAVVKQLGCLDCDFQTIDVTPLQDFVARGDSGLDAPRSADGRGLGDSVRVLASSLSYFVALQSLLMKSLWLEHAFWGSHLEKDYVAACRYFLQIFSAAWLHIQGKLKNSFNGDLSRTLDLIHYLFPLAVDIPELAEWEPEVLSFLRGDKDPDHVRALIATFQYPYARPAAEELKGKAELGDMPATKKWVVAMLRKPLLQSWVGAWPEGSDFYLKSGDDKVKISNYLEDLLFDW